MRRSERIEFLATQFKQIVSRDEVNLNYLKQIVSREGVGLTLLKHAKKW